MANGTINTFMQGHLWSSSGDSRALPPCTSDIMLCCRKQAQHLLQGFEFSRTVPVSQYPIHQICQHVQPEESHCYKGSLQAISTE